jgi:hypothetical protein
MDLFDSTSSLSGSIARTTALRTVVELIMLEPPPSGADATSCAQLLFGSTQPSPVRVPFAYEHMLSERLKQTLNTMPEQSRGKVAHMSFGFRWTIEEKLLLVDMFIDFLGESRYDCPLFGVVRLAERKTLKRSPHAISSDLPTITGGQLVAEVFYHRSEVMKVFGVQYLPKIIPLVPFLSVHHLRDWLITRISY